MIRGALLMPSAALPDDEVMPGSCTACTGEVAMPPSTSEQFERAATET